MLKSSVCGGGEADRKGAGRVSPDSFVKLVGNSAGLGHRTGKRHREHP